MKKIFYILCAIFLSFLITGPSAYAASLISVDFIPDPLFGAHDILPGDTVSGVVKVKNQTESVQSVVVEAINVYDADGLGNQLDITIRDTDTIYQKTLGEFLRNGPAVLGTLAGSAEQSYEFTVSFKNAADNQYEGKTLGFDLCVGFSGGALSCGNTVVSPEGGGGGGGDASPQTNATSGGGGNGPLNPQLFIYGERIAATNVENDSVVIEWATNLLATSQVVYGPQSLGPYTLNMDALFFGYPLGTSEDSLKVTKHSVTIGGLIPGQTYVYRVISRASPPTVSYEHTFVYTKPSNGFVGGGVTTVSGGFGEDGASEDNQKQEIDNKPRSPASSGEVSKSGPVVSATSTGVVAGAAIRDDFSDNLAAVFAGLPGLPDWFRCFHLFVILLALNYLLTRLVDRRQAFVVSKLPLVKLKRLGVFVGLLFVEIMGTYMLDIDCVVVPLVTTFVIGSITFVVYRHMVLKKLRSTQTP